MEEMLGLEAEEIAAAIGPPHSRAMQIFEWLYAKKAESFDEMTNLPQELRDDLARRFTITYPPVCDVQQSKDRNVKYALQAGKEVIEAVHMPEERRDTICISSQAGCSFGCKFCVTARMNLLRQLTAGEIIGEVLTILKLHGRTKQL